MKRGGTVSGAASLIMIFCVLCLSVFATLTVATAERERGLTDLTAQRASEYYAADSRAMEIVNALKRGEDPGVDVAFTPSGEGVLAEFSVPVGESQSLQVGVEMGDDQFRIVNWKTVFSGSWELDDSIDIWDGF